MHNDDDQGFTITEAHYKMTLIKNATDLCDGREDLPLRVLTGRVDGNALWITKLLNYSAHVAVLGLVSTGIHRHDAALMVATKNAGAFQGSISQFNKGRSTKRIKHDALLATRLPDGTDWIVWSRNRSINTDIIPMVHGWDGSSLRSLNDVIHFDSQAVGVFH